jgi:glucose-6-phosphate isomerase
MLVLVVLDLAESTEVQDKIKSMREGKPINQTEDRAVSHAALRASPDQIYRVDGKNIVPDVHRVLNHIKEFASAVRRYSRSFFIRSCCSAVMTTCSIIVTNG